MVFHSAKEAIMGFDSKKYQAEWYQKNKERRREQVKHWKAERPNYHLGYLLRTKYNLTLEQFGQMVEDQNGCCAICFREPSGKGLQNQRLHVDHDAETGKVRGLLCGDCNRAIGLLKHDTVAILRAAAYLEDNCAIRQS
jgi:hypothetical protein